MIEFKIKSFEFIVNSSRLFGVRGMGFEIEYLSMLFRTVDLPASHSFARQATNRHIESISSHFYANYLCTFPYIYRKTIEKTHTRTQMHKQL